MARLRPDEPTAVVPVGSTIGGVALASASTADLRAELARGLSLTADTLTRLGMIWAELERRGEDLSDLRRGIARTLPLIAAGRLAAEAVVAFSGRPGILRAIEGVPIERQRRLAAGEAVPVIDPANPEQVSEMPLAMLPAASIRIVLGEGEVRPPAAQRLALRRPRLKPADDGAGYTYRPRYDPASGTVQVGRMTIQLADLLRELSAAAGPDRPPAGDVPEDYATIKVRVSKDEWRQFQAVCAKAELPDWEMARKALRAFGLIGGGS